MKVLAPLLILIALLTSCGKDKSSPEVAPLIESLPLNREISPGTYAVSCFKNKAASRNNRRDVFTKAHLILSPDGSGLIKYQASFHADCSSASSGKMPIAQYRSIIIDGVKLLEMELPTKNLWLPYAEVQDSLFIDVGQEDDETGAYLQRPDAQALALFKASPQKFTLLK